MTLRQKLACVGLTVFGLQIASAAAGGARDASRDDVVGCGHGIHAS